MTTHPTNRNDPRAVHGAGQPSRADAVDGARSAPYDPLVHLVDGLIGRVAALAVALVVAALAVAVPAGAGAASSGTPAFRPVM